MRWYASAPSNIALIKYMGKTDHSGNRPTNASLSYTLTHLNTHVEIEPKADGEDSWEPLKLKTLDEKALELSEKGKARYLGHFDRIKKHFDYKGSFVVRSVNDFPSDCGLASSASSFAALTLCTYRALKELTDLNGDVTDEQIWQERPKMSELSRQGSGSSCRSFYAPWALWKGEGAEELKLPYSELIHTAIIADAGVKEVSSSEAHKRVTTSDLFQGRIERAESRLNDLVEAFQKEDWKEAFELTWAEFWDMHALFETSKPSFGYMNANTFRVLEAVRDIWKSGDGPICTMDAGPNVHLLYRKDQISQCNEDLKRFAELKLPTNSNLPAFSATKNKS